ncbi:PP2C family protein-serine/threonine phosphatase [Actinomadura yumaensis]|uniref:PP2C family protein-serine/threonine phosphatase n=1 Tax=Actinomadura yumaensis TaxID=111807 RepID=A0ABW2CQP9_9ACTN
MNTVTALRPLVRPDLRAARIVAASATHIGDVRRVQADTIAAVHYGTNLAFTVADGAGDDERSAAVAADAAHEATGHAAWSGEAADALLYARGELEYWTWNGPFDVWYDRTCAIVTAAIGPRHTTIGWLGDCRAYQLLHTGQFRQLTIDHNPGERYAGEWDENPVAKIRAANTLERHIGTGAPGTAIADPGWWRLMLCSDGLYKHLDNNQIGEILKLTGTAQDAADKLVMTALTDGGRDNIAVTVLEDSGLSPYRPETANPSGEYWRVQAFGDGKTSRMWETITYHHKPDVARQRLIETIRERARHARQVGDLAEADTAADAVIALRDGVHKVDVGRLTYRLHPTRVRPTDPPVPERHDRT